MMKETEREREVFELVHPLDDQPEAKRDPKNLGPMRMTASVRISLIALRTYLLLMMLLVLYSVLNQAGVFGQVRPGDHPTGGRCECTRVESEPSQKPPCF